MADEKDPHDKYKKKLDDDVKAANKFLLDVKFSGMKALIDAHEKFDGEIEDDIEGYIGHLHDKLDESLKDVLGIDPEKIKNDYISDSLFQRHYGLTKKSIENLVKSRGDKSVYFLETNLERAWNRLREEHIGLVAQDHINKDTLENAVKYMNLDKLEAFDSDAPKDPAALREAFIYHTIEGGVSDNRLPESLRKEYKSKKEKEEE